VTKEPQYEWHVHRNLETDESILEVIHDDGQRYIEEIDLEVGSSAIERYISYGDDFSSVRGEVESHRHFRRGDWHVRIHTRTRLSCTASEFRVQAQLDAYEGETRVFADSWDERIDRDGV
jgi:hypothetical protein